MTKNGGLKRWIAGAGIRPNRYARVIAQAEKLESQYRDLSDAELTEAAQDLVVEPDESGKSKKSAKKRGPDEKWLATFAAIGREAADRSVDLRPFDVQLSGAMWMLAGTVVEMATGEGKTLSGALTAAGFALRGHRVHVVSVNDYLAQRDAEWMGPLYEMLGVSVGWVDAAATAQQRREAYDRQVTYVSVSELGFDLLRDRLCTDVDELVSAKPDVALVDEADSVLVDEARVPLVLAGSTGSNASLHTVTQLVATLTPGDHYEVDDEARNVFLTVKGEAEVEAAMGGIDLYSDEHSSTTLPEINVALHARALLKRDVHYIVRDGKVELVDASRGRVAELQRWPDGLQAAVEAKEEVNPSDSGEVLDTITVQGLMQRYPILCGMTGTAEPAREQFEQFYKLSVVPLPPNRRCVRLDEPDRIYVSIEDKEAAVVEHIKFLHDLGQPILVGTLDVAESERLAKLLADADIECVVLNAKNDADEAAIIAKAGEHGAVTVSTQIAGRGTDIRLGGHDGTDHERVAELGGLYVLGTGHHPSKRVDDQLRGRSGRQGDPGDSVYFASLEDELVVQHVPDITYPESTDEDGQVDDPQIRRMVIEAQRVAEGVNLDMHANTWKYNRLLEHQRGTIMERREELLRTDIAREMLAERCPEQYAELDEKVDEAELSRAARQIVLHQLDRSWTEHLSLASELRESIHLRVLGRQNPLDEFHREAIGAFRKIVERANDAAVETFDSVSVVDGRIDLADAGVRRPTATWTYLINDNPFGSEMERGIRGLRAKFHRPTRTGATAPPDSGL